MQEGNFVLLEEELLEQVESLTVVEFSRQAQELTE